MGVARENAANYTKRWNNIMGYYHSQLSFWVGVG